MTTERNCKWNTVAWNGVYFQKPIDWEIATIGHTYLMLGTRFEPRMEISWKDIPTPVSQTRYRKKLFARLQKQHLTTVKSWEPPRELSETVSAYDVNWFVSNASESRAYGCVLFCASCLRMSMIRMFLQPDDRYDMAQMSFILASFRDHPIAERCWAVFDILCMLPLSLNIHSYRFSTGFICLHFKGNRHDITISRWSPALALLTAGSLSDFAVSHHLCPQNITENVVNPYRIEFETRPRSKFTLIRPPHCRLHLRHSPQTNRIIAVKAESRSAIDMQLFERIVSQL